MSRYYLHHVFSVLVILLTVIACVLPGQITQPTPDLGPNAIASAVAGTAQAAATQTAAAQPVATSMTGTTIEQLEDGTTQYTDYDAGFEIVFPVGWLAVRPNSEEFDNALAKEGAANPALHDQMTDDLASYNANFDRLFAYILRPDIRENALFGFTYLEWPQRNSTPIESINLEDVVRDLESSSGSIGFHADSAQLRENINKVKIIEVGGRGTVNNGQGGFFSFYATIIFFKPSPDSMARIMFTFLEDYQLVVSTDVNLIIDSITLIEP